MKHLLTMALMLVVMPAYAQDTQKPSKLVVGQSSQFTLQGWTRLNGTAAFETSRDDSVEDSPATNTDDTAARRARLLAAEAEYKKKKKTSDSGW